MSAGAAMMGAPAMAPTQVLSVELQAQEWNVVVAGLYELPAKLSVSVIERLTVQLRTPAQPAQGRVEGSPPEMVRAPVPNHY